jgi:subtilase family serine protease
MLRAIIRAGKPCNHRRPAKSDTAAAHRNAYHRRLSCEPLEDRRLLNASMPFHHLAFDPITGGDLSSAAVGSATPTGYTPAQIRTAYGIDSIKVGSLVGDGAGQTIAIIAVYDNPNLVSSTDATFLTSDLHRFDAAFGLPDPPSFRKLDQNGGTNYPGVDPAGPGAEKSWEVEEVLDVQWAHAIAPQANIVLIEAVSPLPADFAVAIDTARNLPGVSVVSISAGWPEDQLGAAGELAMDSLFTTPAGHQGITFVAASGDDGSPGAYPAHSPNVVAVGGTSLTVMSDGTYSNETGWSGSGGGQSMYKTKPSYQNAVQSTGFRQIPDVAFDGDPNTGVAVYGSYDFGSSSPWAMIGGTSFSAPCWAGLIAIANQLRASQGLGSLDGPSQTLPVRSTLTCGDGPTTIPTLTQSHPPTIYSSRGLG